MKKTGKVKFFNVTKGFGFIVDEDSGKDVFVHVSALSAPINQDDMVEFDEEDGKKGKNAINVSKI